MQTTTILLDLDDTLLGNNINHFLPAYFAGLEKYLRQMIGDQDLRQLMIAAVQAVQANQDPTVTNMAAFMTDFTHRIRQPVEAIQPVLNTFYAEDYPKLQQHTYFRPEAPLLVERLFAEGYKVVVATNPLFPMVAIEQRLEWAGVRDFLYTRITAMENSHFSKPDPRYYQEILNETGSVPETTWMVGDNLEYDILPAQSLGLKTWWVRPPDSLSEPEPPGSHQGSLAELLAWIEAGGLV